MDTGGTSTVQPDENAWKGPSKDAIKSKPFRSVGKQHGKMIHKALNPPKTSTKK